MKASVIILTKNGQASIGRCLDKVCNQSTKHDYEVIIIDSGSVDATLDIIKNYPVKLYKIPPEDFGHSSTRNLGVSLAAGQLLIYLSQDAEPSNENWLDSITRPLLEDPLVGAVFGRHIPMPEADPVNRFRIQWIYGSTYLIKDKNTGFKFPREIFSFSDANAAVRKDLLRQFPFREDILFCEDVYLAKQILTHGHKIAYTPLAAVLHSHNHGIYGAFSRHFDIAVAYRKIGILEQNRKIAKEGKKYIWEELKYLLRNRDFPWVPYSLINNLVKYLGFKAGCAERFIPLPIKKKISQYWYKEKRYA